MPDTSVVGKSANRADAAKKVTGQVLYVGNIEMPGMLHVAVLRSHHPHARIIRIEKSRAESHKGVAAVLTGSDVAAMPGVDPYFGPAFRDQPILAIDRVLHVEIRWWRWPRRTSAALRTPWNLSRSIMSHCRPFWTCLKRFGLKAR